ncbi:hypothetical protein QAD02_024092 [Eretmocerus hayati]|uniref:Uncharacterized protein n=1 Tax=Eretmocerus hayati TaxID=131215 RepID=A0ACC2PXU1_9HYME|nr:hypothetical protein QAD02_024092 [Eretmocerus hayati]
MMQLGSDSSVTTLAASSMGGPVRATWLYLSFEFLVGLGISAFLLALNIFRLLLPRPPRALSGDVVVVTGAASSKLGLALTEEFARVGCSVVCVDEDGPSTDAALASNSNCISKSNIFSDQLEEMQVSSRTGNGQRWYRCDLRNRKQLRHLAEKLRHEFGGIDVLVTCPRQIDDHGECGLDKISHELASHYWAAMAFLPSMLLRDKAHLIGITQAVSKQEACMGSKAAIAGLMASLDEELSGGKHKLTFMTVAPKAEPRLRSQTEREIAKEVVQAVQRDMPGLFGSWASKTIYEFRYNILSYFVLTMRALLLVIIPLASTIEYFV